MWYNRRKEGNMKIGIVGSGSIVNEALPLLSECGWEPAAMCGTKRSFEKVQRICREYSMEYASCDYVQFLQQKSFDIVYIAVPNHLHYVMTKQALEAGKHVILEKPVTTKYEEAKELAELARERNLFLFEAISTLYLPNYGKLKEWLPEVGEVKIVSCNFSQYSRRYDRFKQGEILPVFDPKKAGGALMDLNVYNLHYVVGLFGAPKRISYLPNIERDIDTSGVLTLQYDTFQVVSIAAKDCSAPCSYVIQGTKGYLMQATPANSCGEIVLRKNDGTEKRFDASPAHRLMSEFRLFAKEIGSENRAFCYQQLEHTLIVADLLTRVCSDKMKHE